MIKLYDQSKGFYCNYYDHCEGKLICYHGNLRIRLNFMIRVNAFTAIIMTTVKVSLSVTVATLR